jgi:N-acetyl sugar amidotransferase
MCARCVSDTSIPGIRFDEEGICNYCRIHDKMDKKYPLNEDGAKNLEKLLTDIKRKGQGKKYDCVLGLSGGTDSTYCLYLAKKYGLKPLAVHFDNGWDSEIAEHNIKVATDKLGVDLRVISCDLDEFRDLQISFLRASVPEAEIPTDIAAFACQYKVAAEEGVKYILNGHSFRMEGLAPLAWSNIDGRYIKSVQKLYGKKPLKTFPNLTLWNIIDYSLIKGIKVVHLLDYINYKKEDVKRLLAEDLGWQYYGGHHLESIYTKWVANYLHPVKFGIDKRPIEMSAYIRSGQISKKDALDKLKIPIPDESELTKHVLQKLDLSNEEFKQIMTLPIKSFKDYSTYYNLYKTFAIFISIAVKLNLLGDLGFTFVEKYSTF